MIRPADSFQPPSFLQVFDPVSREVPFTARRGLQSHRSRRTLLVAFARELTLDSNYPDETVINELATLLMRRISGA